MEFVNRFFERMSQNLGPDRARLCIDETLAGIGKRQLRTVDEVVLFAEELMKRGGMFDVIGGALRVQAILHGASSKPAAPGQARAPEPRRQSTQAGGVPIIPPRSGR
jgi:hypothetical protein